MKYKVDISPDAKKELNNYISGAIWMIFQIYEDEHCVKIDYVIDDRQNYGRFVH